MYWALRRANTQAKMDFFMVVTKIFPHSYKACEAEVQLYTEVWSTPSVFSHIPRNVRKLLNSSASQLMKNNWLHPASKMNTSRWSSLSAHEFLT